MWQGQRLLKDSPSSMASGFCITARQTPTLAWQCVTRRMVVYEPTSLEKLNRRPAVLRVAALAATLALNIIFLAAKT
jgi:hypothetical protein